MYSSKEWEREALVKSEDLGYGGYGTYGKYGKYGTYGTYNTPCHSSGTTEGSLTDSSDSSSEDEFQNVPEYKIFSSQYEEVATLGSGHFATVNKAKIIDELQDDDEKDNGEERFVAIKRLKPNYKNTYYLNSEIAIHRTLNSKHVVQYLGTNYRFRPTLLVMEYAEQGTLLRKIKSKSVKLTNDKIINFGYQIVKGLEYIHREDKVTGKRAIIHRDLKLDNILIDKKGNIKIADFGCAQFAKRKEGDPDVAALGALNFQAPELLSGESATTKVDIYALACLLYKMYTNKPMYTGLPREFAKAHAKLKDIVVTQNQRPELPKDMPLKLITVIRLSWHKHPFIRPAAKTLVSCLDDMKKQKNNTVKTGLLTA